MLKRLGKTITNNFSLKILAVILAVVLWVVVINIDDPTTSKTYTTNVVAENTDYITSQNKYYEPLDSSNVVSFRVSAARSVHDELSNADFSATADMENIGGLTMNQFCEITPELRRLAAKSAECSKIDPELYTRYDVKRGLLFLCV